jgi:membrane protein involved in colicin uptake
MSDDHPGRWLVHHAKIALTEFPENAGWLMRKFLTPPPVERAASEARGGARRVSDSIADAVPFGPDSLDLRLHRAQEALEDAERAEERALRKMSEANDLAERVETVTANGRRRQQEAKAASDGETTRRVAEARRRAEAMIAEEQAAAEADASKHLDEVAAQNDAEREDAERRAEEARQHAEAEMDAAREQLAEARALADEAAEAARSAAEEAHRRARAMTEQAEAQSRAADERAAEADKARGSVTLQTAEFVRLTEKAPAADDLTGKTKPELLDLAASLEIEGRSGMTKDDLVKAIRRTAGNRRAAAPTGNGS